MSTAPPPPNEAQRLEALARYQILDTPPELGFDDLTALAAQVAAQPVSLISLIDSERQWFKSRYGTDLEETPREVAFCAHAIVACQPLVVTDATLDTRFRDNPLVTGELAIRFYAGFPLLTSDGFALGTLCVCGPNPAELSPPQRAALERLARQAVSQLELRRTGLELKRALAIADRAGVEAERLSTSRANFLSTASHEMLTPLNAVVGLSELLLGTDLPRDQHALCRDIHDSGEHLQTLLSGMLDLAALEEGHVALDRMPVDLRTEIARVFDMLRPLANPKSVRLVLEPATDLVARRVGDGKRLRQVLGHLVDNAVKFTQNGTVHVRLSEREAGDGRPGLHIDIEDSGTGMAPALVAQIFDTFHQADDTSTRLHGGLGLGLAITRLLVRTMGGSVSVTSTQGSGTTFTLDLPLARCSGPTAAPEHSGSAGERLRGLRLLVVDDVEVNRLLIVRLLHRLGCTAVVACNGAEALAVNPVDYDVVLMDCQMPVMDGFEATRAMRGREARTGSAPKAVIAVTASLTAQDRLRCKDHGMNGYLNKPLTGDALRDMLLAHLAPDPAVRAAG